MVELAELQASNRLLANEKSKYLTVFESLPDPKILVGPGGQIDNVNRAAAVLLGLSARPGSTHHDGATPILPEEIPWLTEHLAGFGFYGQQTMTLERTIETGGVAKVYQITFNRMLDASDKFLGTVVALHDVTDAKQVSQQLTQANTKLSAWIKELEIRNDEVTLLSEMGEMLQICEDPQEAYGVVAQYMHKAYPDATGSLSILSNSRNLLDTVATWGSKGALEKVFQPQDCWGLRRGRAYAAEAGEAPFCRHFSEPLPARTICVPLTANNEPLGLLHVQCHHRPDEACKFKSEGARKFVRTLGENVALALANLRLRDSLKRQSIRDPLTGLYNRRYMEETLERELLRAARQNTPLSLIMIDIDHFKVFNDSNGHEAGDSAVSKIGKLLQEAVRKDDVACRYGGEEFLIILPQMSLNEGMARAETIRRGAADLLMPLPSGSCAHLTLSLGVSAFPEHGTTPHALIESADAALYAAKDAGRDRVVVAPIHAVAAA